jgi:hypothetical protein
MTQYIDFNKSFVIIKMHKVSWYTRQCNFMYAHKGTKFFYAPIS